MLRWLLGCCSTCSLYRSSWTEYLCYALNGWNF